MGVFFPLSLSNRVFADCYIAKSANMLNFVVKYRDGKTATITIPISLGWQGVEVGSTVFDVCLSTLKNGERMVYVTKAKKFAPNPTRVSSKLKNGPIKIVR